jgi:hypothetical protein
MVVPPPVIPGTSATTRRFDKGGVKHNKLGRSYAEGQGGCQLLLPTNKQHVRERLRNYSSFAYSALACFRMGMSGRRRTSFLAQKIQVRVTAGTRIDDGGKVAREVVGDTVIIQRKNKRNFQRY